MVTSSGEPALHSLLARTFPGEYGPILAPTLYLALYIDPVRPEDVRDFVDRARQALGTRLRFYQTGTMTDPAPLSDAKIAEWLDRKLRASKRLEIHTLILNELGPDGVTPSEITLNVESLRIEPLSESQVRRDEYRQLAKVHGGGPLTAGAFLLAGFPLDHPVADPGAFVGWVKQLRAVTGGRLICGSAGIALNLAADVHGADAINQHELAHGLLARHPGLDLMPIFGQRVLHMSADGEVHPRIRRAAWLNLVSGATLDELGGVAKIEAALVGTSARIDRLADDAWLLQSGPTPRVGDATVHDRVREYGAVGRVLKPVRAGEFAGGNLSYSLEWRDTWHAAFDGDELA
jgi:hypothetical protein